MDNAEAWEYRTIGRLIKVALFTMFLGVIGPVVIRAWMYKQVTSKATTMAFQPKIELWPAAGWTCDNCGEEHIIRLVELDHLAEGYVTVIKHPSRVQCSKCGADFEVEYQDVYAEDEPELPN